MIRLALLLWLALTAPVLGQTVRVSSGEHDGFTRLALEFGGPVTWQLGRSTDGYTLRLEGAARGYDLSEVFQLIGKSRLAAIWADPQTGDLNVGLACACHAIPFEFRPGIVVIDLRDGPPPKGSSFELALDGAPQAPLTATAQKRPMRRPAETSAETTTTASYDWTASLRSPAPAPLAEPKPAPLPGADPALQPLRDTIMGQMAKGAAQGVIDMALPLKQPPPVKAAGFASAQIRIGDPPTSVNQPDRPVQGDLGATGATCVDPAALEIASWGNTDTPFSDQFATMRAGLSGEFDRPDPEAVRRSVRFLIYLGFGAEARQTLHAFLPDDPDAPVWLALSHLVDHEADPSALFAGQNACEGPAALWAFLADPKPSAGAGLDTGAVRLAFSALPLHLRRDIAPRLAARFLDLGLEDAARAVSDAVTRAPGEAGAAVGLMTADLNLAAENPAKAEAIAAEVLSDPGPSQPQALIALVEARVAQDLPVLPEIAASLQALREEHQAGDLGPRLAAALTFAQAASGDFEAAFASLPEAPDRAADVWRLTAKLAEDGDFLAHAVLPPGSAVPRIDAVTKAEIAARLVGLGLGAAAQIWLATLPSPDPLLTAEAALQDRDARSALTQLAGTEDAAATALKLRAFDQLGDHALRARLLAEAGDATAASAALARAGDWPALAATGEAEWKALAEQTGETAPTDSAPTSAPSGPLARGHDLLQAGADTRAAIDALLQSVPSPEKTAVAAPQVSASTQKNP